MSYADETAELELYLDYLLGIFGQVTATVWKYIKSIVSKIHRPNIEEFCNRKCHHSTLRYVNPADYYADWLAQ